LEGLRALLATAKESADPKIKPNVDLIDAALKNPSAVRVQREFFVKGSRIDIRISDGKHFLIFVENKKGHNPLEIGKTPQTVRYQGELDKAKDAGRIGLGIYLTPDGTPAKSKDFVAISCGEFARCLRVRLSRQELLISEDTRVLLSAFALTYAWIN
jgi:hypothetical protein